MTDITEIAIIGAGLGGLTLARILQQHGRDAVVFERDASRNARQLGGTLDMHRESGQSALASAGLEAEFQAIARPEGQVLRIVDKTGASFWEEVGDTDSFARPEVDRGKLRNLLIDSLKPGRVCWGYRLINVVPHANGGYTLRFENGEEIRAGIVIGADGANSGIRPLLTDAKPFYSGVSFIEASIPDADETHPVLSDMVGHGSFMALADNKGLLAQRNGDGRIRLYIALRVSEDEPEISAFFRSTPEKKRRDILAIFHDWTPALTDLIHACDDSFITRPINMLPIGITWESKPDITLLGDAAHLMSPFAGKGANLAMFDAAELAGELIRAQTQEEAIRCYEARMFTRVKPAAEESAQNLDLCIAPEGAKNMAKQMAFYTGREQ